MLSNTQVNQILEQVAPEQRALFYMIFNQMSAMHAENVANQERRHREVLMAQSQLRKFIASGFPDGDPVGHCLFHQAEIRKAIAREKMADSIKERSLFELIRWGVPILFGSLLVTALIWLKDHLK